MQAGTVSDEESLRLQIRRTEFGVRGAYLNAIDRFRGAQLASIFSTHLSNVQSEVVRLRNANRSQSTDAEHIEVGEPITIAVGYDGRTGAADVFSGVVSAVLQNGCHVLEAGQSTAASLLHVSRRFPHLCGSLLVTGAGGNSGDLGLDAFDPYGQGLAVPWAQYGVTVRMHREGSAANPRSVMDNEDFAVAPSVASQLHHLRTPRIANTADTMLSSEEKITTLQLPGFHGSAGGVFRGHRRSGSLSSVPSEKHYREWLLRWWPIQSRQSARFLSTDGCTAQRLQWLVENCSLNLEVLRQSDVQREQASARHSVNDGLICFELHEDDRFLTVRSRRHRELSVDELVAWLNRCMPSSSAHLTAHASPCGRRVLLVDVAAPDSGHQQQVINDGLALAGWILTSMSDGANPLPV